MRPLLASLALLLLALSRQSSAGISWDVKSFTSESSQTSVSFISKEKKQVVSTRISKAPKTSDKEMTAEQQLKLFNLIANTILMAGIGEELQRVPFLAKALLNGMQCELKDSEEPKFNEVLYGHNPQTPAERAEEEKAAKQDSPDSKGIDCAAAAPTDEPSKSFFDCFCTRKKELLYCFFFTSKEVGLNQVQKDLAKEQKQLPPPAPCRDKTVPALINSGVLGKEYDLDSFGKNGFDDAFSGNVDGITGKESDKMRDLFCDALNPVVENAVKAVYASDALYWITESLLYSIIFGPPEKPLPETCQEEEFKSSEFGKCVCKQDTGYTFCIYKVIAEFFQKENYLDCAAKKFVPEKKPAKLLPLPHKGSAPKKSATTAFSLLAPLAAAAAAMLLRH